MMITYVGLISRAKMDEFRRRFGGFTWDAFEEFVPVDVGVTGDIIKRLPKARGMDSDSRHNWCALQTMELAIGLAAKDAHSTSAAALVRALSFYWPLVPQGGIIDDTGGREPAVATVLSPQRSRHLLDCWQRVNLADFEGAFANHPEALKGVSTVYAFDNGAHLTEYLRFYETQLAQVVAEDRFYMTCYG
jgi:hypothetical protein